MSSSGGFNVATDDTKKAVISLIKEITAFLTWHALSFSQQPID